MTVRIAGGVILLISAVFLGVSLNTVRRSHLHALRRTVELIRQIRRSIDLFNTPRDAACNDFHASMEELCAALAEDAQIVREFSEKLGSGYKDDTLKLCDFTMTTLEDRLKKAENEYPAHARLYITLPVFAALSLIVMIL